MVTGWREPAPAVAGVSCRQAQGVSWPLPGALAGEDIREDCGAQVPGCGWLEP